MDVDAEGLGYCKGRDQRRLRQRVRCTYPDKVAIVWAATSSETLQESRNRIELTCRVSRVVRSCNALDWKGDLSVTSIELAQGPPRESHTFHPSPARRCTFWSSCRAVALTSSSTALRRWRLVVVLERGVIGLRVQEYSSRPTLCEREDEDGRLWEIYEEGVRRAPSCARSFEAMLQLSGCC